MSLSTCALSSTALPCTWDRDTLAFELRNRPDTQRALTGWFDRFPHEYYEVRIKRLEADISLDADELNDLAVAYERLGQTDKAIATIERKTTLQLDSDDRYTYHANKGTFYAHRWVAKRDKKDLDIALADIKKAIEINPDAHFGREKVQLYVLEAISKDVRIGEYLGTKMEWREAEKGLAGLIMLGSAWESPDIAAALAYTVRLGYRGGNVIQLARFRYDELLKNGKMPLTKLSEEDIEESKHAYMLQRPEDLRPEFDFLRKAADKRHSDLTSYVEARLAKGIHPDTAADFWSDWKEPKLPEPPSAAFDAKRVQDEENQRLRLICFACVAMVASAWMLWRIRSRYS